VFIGTSYPKLDEKFRLILPAKFRDRLAGGVVLTKGQENCVVVMTRAEYESRAAALMQMSKLQMVKEEFWSPRIFVSGPALVAN
jgi:MraZ protein